MDGYTEMPSSIAGAIADATGNSGRTLAVTMTFEDWLSIYYSAVNTENITPLGARLRDAIADAAT
jgi:hypothetical protein